MKHYKTIAELLSQLKSGTQVYSPIFGVGYYDRVKADPDGGLNIYVVSKYDRLIYEFDENGYSSPTGEMMLKPARFNRDWRIMAWEKGDVLTNDEGKYCVFKAFAPTDDPDNVYDNILCAYLYSDGFVGKGNVVVSADSYCLASEDDRERVIAAIENIEGGKYNPDTLKVDRE